jgi:hypothetical protein
MGQTQTDISREEVAQRGDELYDRVVQPALTEADTGKFVLIDVNSGDFEVDKDEIAASDRLLARRPEARVWLRRAGSRYARRFGWRYRPAQ